MKFVLSAVLALAAINPALAQRGYPDKPDDKTPAVVTLATLFAPDSANQTLPSGPSPIP